MAVLLAGAAGCLLLRRHTAATATSSPAEAINPPAGGDEVSRRGDQLVR